jgi:hypothetical protein
VTRQTRILLGVVVALGALAAYWFLLLAPKREEAAALEAKVAEKQAAVAQAESTLQSYRQAAGAYKRLYTTVTRLGKAVPEDDDTRSLVVQLESAADGSDVNFSAITTAAAPSADAGATAAPATKLPPGAAPVGTAGFASMAFDLEFKGSFLRLTDLFTRLERFVTVDDERIDVTGRLLRVDGIALSASGGDPRDLTATVKASTFLVPPGEGLTVGATAQGPAASAGGSPPAGGATTPPVTTATTTGALR